MSKKLVPISPEKTIKILEKFGFRQLRQKGSHLILENNKGKSGNGFLFMIKRLEKVS